MMFIAIKTKDGVIKGKLSFYCRMLGVSRQGFYKYLAIKDRPWKYQDLADAMRAIHAEDECNDTYGRIRMYQALLRKRVKDQDKEIRRLKEENEFLEEASAFLAASGRKSARTKE